MKIEFYNNTAEKRFEAYAGQHVAFIEYRMAGNHLSLIHTEVPAALSGKGVGNQLAEYVLQTAKEQGWRIHALCPFVAAYIEKHPEHQAITVGY